ncbi:hypothetical protein NMG60_11005877 [Bertholletia excelsa]
MEDANNEAMSRKRSSRDNSDFHSPEAKRVMTDSDFSSSKVDLIHNEILHILDDESDTETDGETATPDLESVIRSFEEEIRGSPTQHVNSSEPSGSGPELGYLLEASDDELGLPPSVSPSVGLTENQKLGWGNMQGFEEVFPNCNLFLSGIGEEYEVSSSELGAGGGLLDEEESLGFAEFLWRPESDNVHAQ